jgi:radical SAM superfamily enzyme
MVTDCKNCDNQDLTETEWGDTFCVNHGNENCLQKPNPEITPEKVLQLEEMINEWINNKGTWLYLVVFDSAYAIHKSNLESPAEEIFVSIGDTRLEALASLFIKIDWSEDDKKAIRTILEG